MIRASLRLLPGAFVTTVLLFLALTTSSPAHALELILFGKTGCVWCARWEREVGRDYPNAAEAEIAPLGRMDVRDQDTAGLELRERVLYTPTFVLVDRGVEVGRITGYRGQEAFWAELDGMLPPRQRY